MLQTRDLWTMSTVAFLDESSVLRSGGHVYVFGLLLVPPEALGTCETQIRHAAGRQERIHFADSPAIRRRALVQLMQSLPVDSLAIASLGEPRAEVGWKDQPLLWGADIVAGSVSRAIGSSEPTPFPVVWA